MNSARAQPRGFVVIVVLMLLGVMAAVVVTQLRVIEGQEVMGLRSEEEVKARAIAEGCLGLMQAYVDGYARKNRDAGGVPTANDPPDYFLAPGEVDFDRLLDRDGTGNNADDYQPTFGTSVMVPKGTSTAGEVGAKHRWKLLRRDGGACLMRFEDNSDDFFLASTLPSGTATGPEAIVGVANAFRDVTFRDRDRAIYLVAAGVYPALAATPDADVYHRAHARVTLRRLFAAPVPANPVAGVFAGGEFESKNGATVCGVGGVEAGALDFKNVSCMCGPVESTASLGKTPITTGCGACATCAPGSVTAGVPLTPRRFDINGDALCGPAPPLAGPGNCEPLPSPPGMALGPRSFRDNEGLGAPGSAGNDLGDRKTCNFYGESDGKLFVWDRLDPNAKATLEGFTGLPIAGIPTPVDCRSETSANLPEPCAWDPATDTVVCGVGQSPCWKLIAHLGDNANTNVQLGTGAIATGAAESNNLTGGGEEWRVWPGALPNVAGWDGAGGGKRFGVLTSSADYLCGADGAAPALAGITSCASCPGGTATDAIEFQPSSPDVWQLDEDSTNEKLPVPVVMFLETPLGREVSLTRIAQGSARPTRLTVLSNGTVRIDENNFSMCCATCDCNTYSSLIPTCGSETGVGSGFAVKSDQDCILDDDPRITGSLHCGDFVNIINNPCITGNIAAYGSDGSCSGATCGSNVGVCFRNNADIDGMVFALNDVCGKNNTEVRGGIYTERNVDFKNNFNLTGQLYANGDIELKNNAIITFNGNGAFSNLGSPGLTSFMEAAW